MVKYLPTDAGDMRDVDSILGSGRSPGGGHGHPLQDSCLENPMDREAWWATVHRVEKSLTRLKRFYMQMWEGTRAGTSNMGHAFFLSVYFLFFGCTVQHVGSWFLNQGSNPMPPALGAQSLNHWTTREVSLVFIEMGGDQHMCII